MKPKYSFVAVARRVVWIGAVGLTTVAPACSRARSAEPLPSCVPARPLVAAYLAEQKNVLRVRPVSNGSDGAKSDPAAGWFDEAGVNETKLAGLDATVRWLPRANGLHRTRTLRGGHKMAPIARPYVNLGPEWRGVAQLIKQDEATRMSWELTLPNGEYEVFLALGDVSYANGDNNVRLSSGASTVDLTDPDGPDHFDLWAGRIHVTDGRLMLTPQNASKSARIVQVAIARVGVDPIPPVDARPTGEVVKRFEMRAPTAIVPPCPVLATVQSSKIKGQ